ncbi:RES domain-containing protein [Selenomonas ruminantium]|uniref:RES domain-containing protein n=1 Tax=Selenomonas ruminantium TaxID=971 RepID=UPI0015A1732D
MQKGKCDFCYSKNVPIIGIDDDNQVVRSIMALLDLYEVSNVEGAKSIEDALCDDWKIFNLNKNDTRKLIEAICENNSFRDSILHDKVIIPELNEEEFLNEHSITGGLSWDEFADYIKNVNRFHTNFNSGEFASYLSALVKVYKRGTVFYRGRIAQNSFGYKTEEMMAPPKDRRTAGRINPEGMLALYMSLDPKTILYEIRSNVYDYITIGKLVAKRDFRVVDLSGFEYLSPFDYVDGMEKFAVNFKIF